MGDGAAEVRIVGPRYGQAAACEPILRALGPWFGIEAATAEYVRQTDRRPTWLALDADGRAIGFLTVAAHFPHAWELLVMGVAPDRHRLGAGRALVEAVEAFARARGVALWQVKTLAPTHPDAGYAQTRAFYEALGFLPLELLEDLWDPTNPAMIYAKTLQSGRGEEPFVRAVRTADAGAVAQVHDEAFGVSGSAEARLVEELGASGLGRVSLLAELDGEVVGHVLLSELRLLTPSRDEPGLALAPVGVRPGWQGRGVGSMLVRAALFAARELGHTRVLVLGDPVYYRRFGFSAALAESMKSLYAGPAFQAVALDEGAFSGLERATVLYPDAFEGV